MSTILETRGLTHVYGAGTPFERVALDHVDLQIFEEKSKKIEEMVLNDKLDLGVVVEPFHNPKLELKTVFRSEAVLAVSKDHRFADRKEIDFAALK